MLWETILLAGRAIRRNLLRSILTMIGIIVGVGAVITMVTLGGGATAQVTQQISSLGTNLLQVRPGQGFRGPGGVRSEAPLFTAADAEAIEREISGLAAAAPVANAATQAIYGNRNWSTAITGSTNQFLHVRNWTIASGRSFTDREMRAGKAVVILGSTVKNQLFGAQDPLGATIRLQKLACQVIGVLESKGQSSFGTDQDDFVLIPLKTLHRRVVGNTDVSAIYVSAADGVSTERKIADIQNLLRERRRLAPGDDDNFHVSNMREILNTLTGTTRVLTGLLGAVAAVSLLVGGIGIMNIMLVSVTERTREIGIRLAIGALEREVLLQFLVEAMVLSSFGGLLGIGAGLGAAALGSRILQIPFVPNYGILVVAVVFSGAIGILFGYFPARKAARLDPIEALRYE